MDEGERVLQHEKLMFERIKRESFESMRWVVRGDKKKCFESVRMVFLKGLRERVLRV